MKKILVILTVLLVVFIGIIFTAPFLFKDNLLRLLDQEIEKNVSAEVYFDPDKVSLSLIKHFPNLTITLEDFGVIGVEAFKGDTLADVKAFDLTVNLGSVIWGDQVQLQSINLVDPRIMILVLADGTANYDIAKDSGEVSRADTTTENGFNLAIDNWNIKNGRIVYFDQASNVMVAMAGLNHTGSGDFSSVLFDMTTSTTIDDLMVRYNDITYLENKKMVADMVVQVDLDQSKYTLKENRISLNDFSIGMDGFVKINPESYDIDLSYEGKDNTIKSLLSLVPGAYKEGYENISAEGQLDFNGNIRGIYQEEPSQIPAFRLALMAKNGLIQYPDLPEAIRNIQIDLLVDHQGNDVDQTTIDVNRLHLEFGKNPVDATMKIKNLVDYNMVADIKARLNLDDMTKIYPLKDTELSGNVNADIHIEGVYDSVKHTIPVSGKLDINQLSYAGPDLSLKFGIDQARTELTTQRVSISQFSGYLGKSDLTLTGYLNNYMAYLLEEDQPIQGEFDFRSNELDLNEWMASDDSTQTETQDTVELEVVKIPENLDFVLHSEMNLVYYDNLELRNVKGDIRMKDGILKLENLDFNTLGGDFVIGGTYDTRDIENPSFDFQMDIQKLSIPRAYRSFFTIKQLAPIANLMEGDFSTDFKLSGKLKPNMMPDLATLSGSGVLEILDAAIKGADSKVISGITSLTNLSQESTNVTLKDVLMTTRIIDGKVLVQPFTISMGGNKAVVAGSYGLDGSLDYRLKLDVPPGLVQSATSLVSSAIGQDLNVDAKDVKLNLGIGGTYKDPKINILGAESGGNEAAAKNALKTVVDEEKEKLEQQAEKKLDEQTEQLLDQTGDMIEQEEVKDQVDKAKETLKQLLKKKGG